jgi:predicted DNA-binding transcriptional regulator YafY
MNVERCQSVVMRAGRLVTLMLILQRRGRVTAAELAAELEVSERTVLRDIEALSGAGVPVHAVRGPGGGFQMLDGFTPTLPDPGSWQPKEHRGGRPIRAEVLITPDGRRLAVVLGRLQPMRVRRPQAGSDPEWLEATFRVDTVEATVIDVLSLGSHVRVVAPVALRDAVAEQVHRAAAYYAPLGWRTVPRPQPSARSDVAKPS